MEEKLLKEIKSVLYLIFYVLAIIAGLILGK